jgi:thiol-disulfide isomerase/thioredoxin
VTSKRQRFKTQVAVALAALVAIGVFAYAANRGGGGAEDRSATRADAFDLPRLGAEGRVVLADYAGQPTVINMFASWCTQCDAELPEFHAAAKALRGKVNFVFVNSNETGSWRPMATRHGILDFDVAKDVGGTLHNGLYRSLGGTGGMPLTAFYDSDGHVIQVARGALVGNSLREALERLYGVTY